MLKCTDRRTAVDFAHLLKQLSDTHFPDARKIKLVQDNLNTHTPASLTRRSPPRRHAAWSNGSTGTTPPNTAAG